MTLREIEPKALWSEFIAFNAVPRASKKEEAIRAFVLSELDKMNLPYEVDEVGNVKVEKAASRGYESRSAIALQAHLDMVHQKNASTSFDFATQGIEMYVDGDWVRAKGTTLGADNGLGVAAILAVLRSDTIEHPALQVLFTIDEETGMTGAKGLKEGWLTAPYLLNLDTEEDDELTIGCAGGLDTLITADLSPIEAIPSEFQTYALEVKGLFGGHSGTDIHLGRGNANKILFRILNALLAHSEVYLTEVDGGSLRNAIPREAKCVFSFSSFHKEALLKSIEEWEARLKLEYSATDPSLQLVLTEVGSTVNSISHTQSRALIKAVMACFNGIFRMSPSVAGLVETSSNLARIILKDGQLDVQGLQRSSVDSAKYEVSANFSAPFELIGAQVVQEGEYPGWIPDPNSDLVSTMHTLYRKMFNEEPKVLACHAGLECGLIGKSMPNTQMISFGPTIRNAHSPDECAQISSSQKFWSYFLEALKSIK